MLPWMERMAEEKSMVGEGIQVSGGGSPFTLFPLGKENKYLPVTKESQISEMSVVVVGVKEIGHSGKEVFAKMGIQMR